MRHRANGIETSLHATLARICTYPAMLMVMPMTFAFVTTQATNSHTRFEHAPDRFSIRSGSTSGNATRHVADISAIEVEPNTLLQLVHHLFGETSISTSGARLRT